MDISEIKIAIDKANREMYEALSRGKIEKAIEHAMRIEKLGRDAQWALLESVRGDRQSDVDPLS